MASCRPRRRQDRERDPAPCRRRGPAARPQDAGAPLVALLELRSPALSAPVQGASLLSLVFVDSISSPDAHRALAPSLAQISFMRQYRHSLAHPDSTEPSTPAGTGKVPVVLLLAMFALAARYSDLEAPTEGGKYWEAGQEYLDKVRLSSSATLVPAVCALCSVELTRASSSAGAPDPQPRLRLEQARHGAGPPSHQLPRDRRRRNEQRLDELRHGCARTPPPPRLISRAVPLMPRRFPFSPSLLSLASRLHPRTFCTRAAIRMAQDLGLFRDVEKWYLPIQRFAHEEKQARKRVWWACVILGSSLLSLARIVTRAEGRRASEH